MKIEQGHLAASAKLLVGPNSGHNKTFQGDVLFFSEQAVRCHVKLLENKPLASELLFGLLAPRLGLPSPQGYLVKVATKDFPTAIDSEQPAATFAYAYGSKSMDFSTLHASNLSQHYPAPAVLAKSWHNWVDVMVFDEWIANGGRDYHDALLDDSGKIWAIDHEQALRTKVWDEIDLKSDAYTTNQILEKIGRYVNPEDKPSVLARVKEFGNRVTEIDVVKAANDSGISAFLTFSEFDLVIDFLEGRKANLISTLINRLRY